MKSDCGRDSALAVHRSGAFMYTSRPGDGVEVWVADRSTGRLSPAGIDGAAMGKLRAMEMAPTGDSVIGVSHDGRVTESFIDVASSRLNGTLLRAKMDSPRSVALVS